METSFVYKIDIVNADTMYVTTLEHPDGGAPRGIFIADHYDIYSGAFLSIANNAGNDRLDIWQLYANTSWMMIEPAGGTIDPEDEQNMVLTLDATNMPEDIYEGKMVFTHNAVGGETEIPITLTVVIEDIVSNENVVIPTEFKLYPAYPNPFNSTTTIRYGLPRQTDVTLVIYDMTGRLVATLQQGKLSAGWHSTSWQADGIAAGVYMAVLSWSEGSKTGKLIMIR
jgi:hypothetical protein